MADDEKYRGERPPDLPEDKTRELKTEVGEDPTP